MSQAPFAVRNIRFGTVLGANMEVRLLDFYYDSFQFEDTLWQGLTDQYIKTPMGITAEKLGAQYKLTRKEVDEFAFRSQTRWRLGWLC